MSYAKAFKRVKRNVVMMRQPFARRIYAQAAAKIQRIWDNMTPAEKRTAYRTAFKRKAAT